MTAELTSRHLHPQLTAINVAALAELESGPSPEASVWRPEQVARSALHLRGAHVDQVPLYAAPAHASALRGVYFAQAECLRTGWYGHDNYGWGTPECLQQDQYGQPQSLWFLYS